MVRFAAPVFDDGLTRQAFVLTASSVLKAAAGFGLVATRRAEELAAWKEYEATSERRRKEQLELIDRMTVAAPVAAGHRSALADRGGCDTVASGLAAARRLGAHPRGGAACAGVNGARRREPRGRHDPATDPGAGRRVPG